MSDRPGLAARQVAARLLAAVVERKVPADGLTDEKGGNAHFLALSAQDRALVRAILMVALRHRVAIGTLIAEQLDRPLPPNAHALGHILHVALAQMLFLDVPARAAVDLAVEHAGRDPRTRRFAKLANAVLRAILRWPPDRLRDVIRSASEMPPWLEQRLVDAHGRARTQAIAAAHLCRAPVDFTVKSRPEAWAERLGGFVLPTGSVRVALPAAPIPELPGYREGEWWVQDAASALPARLFPDLRGARVADLCAAPGGKTAQLALTGAEVTAIELSASRMKRLAANLERLGLHARLVQADLFEFAPDAPFDAVLLDAPCSSTGTIRRHPDIAWTKTAEDVDRLAALQWRMLQRALQLLRPGGVLVFSNCSLDPAEGEALAARMAQESAQARLLPIAPDEFGGVGPFVTGEGYLRTLPDDLAHEEAGNSGMDGFFAARFRRIA